MYIEWFLLDNTLMNYWILKTAGAILSSPPKRWLAWILSFLGGVWALMALALFPFLLSLPAKLLLAALMTLPFIKTLRDFLRAFFALIAATFLAGGCVYALTFLLGGSFTGGVLIAAPSLRAILAGGLTIASFPRLIRRWHARRAQDTYLYPMRLTHRGKTREFKALLDTGNALQDPLSGLPVIVLTPELMPEGAFRPIPCETVAGDGMLYILAPDRLEILDGDWMEVQALIAAAPNKIQHADALFGAALLPNMFPSGKEQSNI